ncbi:hypothetical protein MtrunA17_Chr5g0424781 [Medicago truncatula]|nr:hypothetical protein MtrunA17_Chr5g0424781 [Medicago truncatula]
MTALDHAQYSSPQQIPYSSPPITVPQLPPPPPASPFIAMPELPNSTMGSLNQTWLDSDTFSAGMQGARHDHLSVSDDLLPQLTGQQVRYLCNIGLQSQLETQ